MKTIKISIILFAGFVNFCNAQGNDHKDGNYIYYPVPYPYVREADIMWSKTIWRIINLREKMNLPLYYPTVPMDNRLSLIDLLLYGIEKEGIVAYSPDEEDEFSKQMSWKDIEDRFGVRNDTVYIEDPETGESVMRVIKAGIVSSEVKKIMIKELWYFDKQTSQLEVKIIGICPIREYERTESTTQNTETDEEPEIVMKKLFWVNFPSVRFLFANNFVFNPFNDAARLSFDNLFYKRRFSSYVYMESNVYDNRFIGEYKQGLDALLEAKNIEDEIFVFEHDLWEH
ncbi:MAG: gliding motility protein GldN [Bacteroidia bacterium]|nr:gliding motility protein GldN [Bacteroidia bacterium]